MISRQLAALLLQALCLAAMVSAAFAHRERQCATRQNLTKCERGVLYVNQLMESDRRSLRALSDATIDIPVYFHSIGTTDRQNHLNDEHFTMIKHAMKAAVADTGFRFKFQGLRKRHNTEWHNCYYGGSQFQAKLRRGGRDALNIYFCNLKHFIGYSSFPHEVVDSKDENAARSEDGIVMVNPSIESGIRAEEIIYTVQHEWGHWMGLLHTFQGSCDGDSFQMGDEKVRGDGVDDTHPHKGPSWNEEGWKNCFKNFRPPQGLESGKNKDWVATCPTGNNKIDATLFDPVNNNMNYIHENCMKKVGEFTENQLRRMKAQWRRYRDPNRRRLMGDLDEIGGPKRRLNNDVVVGVSEDDIEQLCEASLTEECGCKAADGYKSCNAKCGVNVLSVLEPFPSIQQTILTVLNIDLCLHDGDCASSSVGPYCVLATCRKCRSLLGLLC